MRHLLLSLPTLLLVPALAPAQDITGSWYGLLDLPANDLRITIHVQDLDGELRGTLDSPDQGAAALQLTTVKYEDGEFSFTLEAAGASYTGTVDDTFSAITGTFSQGGQDFELLLGRTPLAAQEGGMEWLKERLTKTEVYVPMRDGVRLFTSIYTPRDTTRPYPILLWRTPYNIEPAGETAYNGRLGVLKHFVKEGYILAFQDVRGRYMSEGTFEDVRPYNPNKTSNQEIDENSDTYDTIEYLVNNVPHNSGRVGILGISYPGFYATMSLPDAHPALKAASPQAPVTDWFIGDDFHHNGAFFLLDAFSFYSSFGRPRPEPTRQFQGRFDWPTEDNYDFFLDIGPIKNIGLHVLGDSIQFWQDLMSHPNYDDFWKARNPRPHLTDIKPAVLTVGGWFDAEDLFGPLSVYEAIETQNQQTTDNRIIMGPWSHGQWASGDARNMGNIHWQTNTSSYYKDVELSFFNYHLKGKGELKLAEATMFDTGAGEWMEFGEWPPANTTSEALYFHSGGRLSFSPPTASEGYDEYWADPKKPVPYTEDVHLRRTREYMTDDQRFAARRPDVMVYESEPLQDSVTLAGPIMADLFVSTTGTDADYVVKVIDVFPDSLEGYPENDKDVPMAGYQMLVRGEVLRGRFRNSFENPEPFVPGEVTSVHFDIPDAAHTFKKGHRIMIQVQNSWFPLVDRNPQRFVNIYEADEDDFQKAMHRIYHDAARPSNVKITVLNR